MEAPSSRFVLPTPAETEDDSTCEMSGNTGAFDGGRLGIEPTTAPVGREIRIEFRSPFQGLSRSRAVPVKGARKAEKCTRARGHVDCIDPISKRLAILLDSSDAENPVFGKEVSSTFRERTTD